MRKYILIITATLLLFCLTGCSLTRSSTAATETDADEITYLTSMKELKENSFYVYHDKKYYPVYMKNASFKDSEESVNTRESDDRTLYFNKDFNKIPTFYKGDALIYYTSDKLTENFVFERFEDFGYSIGISNLKRLDSGRYSFDAVKDTNSDNAKLNINPNSDANRLYELNKEQLIIDNIGGAQLRSGNISRGGIIIGLEKDKLYSTDIYTGSKLKNYILVADTRMLTSMEACSINDYSFLRSKVLKVNIPDYFNDGYYMINGKGIFRYVNGDTYTEKSDFNIPNNIPEEDALDNEKTDEETISDSNGAISEDFTINEDSTVEITFTYGEAEGDYELADPIVKIIGKDSAHTLSEDDENTQKLITELKAGQYKIEMTGLSGRTYEYKVVKKNAK